MATTIDTTSLLHLWENGVGKSAPKRALLLITAASNEDEPGSPANWTIGRRDSVLLKLRESMFGPEIHCLTDCMHCGESIELDFHTNDISVPHGEAGRAYHTNVEGYTVLFRLPDTTDLLELDGALGTQAERELLSRCILKVQSHESAIEVTDLPDAVLSAVSEGMAEADPQAEILLEVVCPACTAVSQALFDIVSHLWTELDSWARRILQEVHALAISYGWSETEILQMSAARRRTYLDFIGA